MGLLTFMELLLEGIQFRGIKKYKSPFKGNSSFFQFKLQTNINKLTKLVCLKFTGHIHTQRLEAKPLL